MAYLVQKPRRVKQKDGTYKEVPGNFYICWRDRQGKQRTEATGTDKRGVADRKLKLKDAELVKHEVEAIGGVFHSLWSEFMSEQVVRLSEASERNYRVAGEHYFMAAVDKGGAGWRNARVEQLTTRDIKRYFNWLIDPDNSNRRTVRRVNTLQSLLSGFYSWMWENDIVAENPVLRVKKIKNPPLAKRTINYEQAMLCLKHIDSRYYPHLAVFYFAGLRISELRGLQFDSLSESRRQLTVSQTIYRNGERAIQRTGKPFTPTKSLAGRRKIPLPTDLYDILVDWKHNGWHNEVKNNRWDLMFPSRSGKPLGEDALRDAIKEAGIRAAKEYYDWDHNFPGQELDPEMLEEMVNRKGIRKEPFRLNVMGPHLFRHGFARFALESAHYDLKTLQLQMGHANYSISLQYAEWLPEKDAEVDTRPAALMDAALAGKNAGIRLGNRDY